MTTRKVLSLFLLSLAVLAGATFVPTRTTADEARQHWALRARTRPEVPKFDDAARSAWVRNPIDAFVLERLTREGLQPSAEADRATLIRRVTFDLTGLPPTPAEIAAFVADKSSDAYERLVDRLLDSPRYGERWGRHWLDVVRYAETEGYEYDRERPGAWRFRDYVIDSFNADKPYDRFVQEQLAGDELEPENHTLLVAAGFHRLGAVRRNAGNQEVASSRNEALTEMTDIVGAAFLGLTIGCARCHDHMFDEIPQADYYSLQAFMAATQEHDIVLASPEEQAAWKTTTEKLTGEIRQVRRSISRTKDEAEKAAAREKLRELQKSMPAPIPTLSSVRDVDSERTPIHLLARGNPDKKGKQVGPHFLTALTGGSPAEFDAAVPRPRAALASWIVSAENPLAPRVMVNRIWQRHFGLGIVKTTNDFGVNGSEPSHPELLDWLANDFVAGGWQIKRMHRQIVQSSTYRQSNGEVCDCDGEEVVARAAKARAADPENRLLGRVLRRRLDAEEVRDAMLAISGRLNLEVGGPSVLIPVDADLVNLLYAPAQWIVTADPAQHDRRSIYLHAKRNLRLPFMEAFDQPDAQTSCAQRQSSTHALQSMELLNGTLSNDLAGSLAERLAKEAGSDPIDQVDLAWRLAAGRAPNGKEQSLAIEFLQGHSLKEFALALFNLNVFLYVN